MCLPDRFLRSPSRSDSGGTVTTVDAFFPFGRLRGGAEPGTISQHRLRKAAGCNGPAPLETG